ncbi:MAG: zinc-ribbon domain-containing protein [Candidatus Binatia bacterium]
MALIACRECGKEISDQAPQCPHCGYQPHGAATAPPPKRSRWWLWAFGIFVFLVWLGSQGERTGGTRHDAKLLLAIEEPTYERGYFKLLGVAESVGKDSVFSPTIILRVYDSTGKTLLAEDKTWPSGQFLHGMTPGTSAAFQHFISVPGEPNNIRWILSVDGVNHEVVKK